MGHLKKPGRVINIRLNPTECLQVLDFLKFAGISTEGKSFSTCGGIVLHALLHDAQVRGVLSNPDGFEFNNRMEPFLPESELANRTFIKGIQEKKEDLKTIEEAQYQLQNLVNKEEKGNRLTLEERELKEHLTRIILE